MWGYYDWLVGYVAPDYETRDIYQNVFNYLYDTDFKWFVKNDDNRAQDGLELRSTFENYTGETCDKIGECSVLEMMVALAIRCESDLMYDPDEGNRTSEWFWIMMENLKLNYLSDDVFDAGEFYTIIDRFLDHTYDPDGYGGPFYIHNFKGDMRKIELWSQLNYYLEEEYSL